MAEHSSTLRCHRHRVASRVSRLRCSFLFYFRPRGTSNSGWTPKRTRGKRLIYTGESDEFTRSVASRGTVGHRSRQLKQIRSRRKRRSPDRVEILSLPLTRKASARWSSIKTRDARLLPVCSPGNRFSTRRHRRARQQSRREK